MKRLIRASVVESKMTMMLNIDIYYEEIESELSVAASTSINKSDFYDFVQNVAGILDARNFKVVENHKTNRKGSLSYYFSFYPTDENGDVLDDFLINFRISSHFVKDLNQKSRGYYNAIAREHKSPNQRFQKYRVKNILIGKKSCKTIHESLLIIEHICDELEKSNYDALYE